MPDRWLTNSGRLSHIAPSVHISQLRGKSRHGRSATLSRRSALAADACLLHWRTGLAAHCASPFRQRASPRRVDVRRTQPQHRAGRQALRIPPRLRKFALSLHVMSSVGLLGSIAAFLALAIAGLSGQEAQMIRTAYPAMQVI